jgi:hypothetical protein
VDAPFPNAEYVQAIGPGVLEVGRSLVLKSVRADSGGTVRIAPAGNKVLVTPSLIVSATSAVDLTDNALVYDYAGPSPLAAYAARVRSGFAGGAWNGPGIRSSSAAGNDTLGVGYAEAAQLMGPFGGTFLGSPVDGTALVFRTTLLGDATLDGVVDFRDLARLAQSYNTTTGALDWYQGDFTYDGNVDFEDLTALAQNYNTALPNTAPAGASADFARDFALARAQVPEPSALGWLAVAAGGLLRRRRGR